MAFESLSKQLKVMSDAGTNERESEAIGKQKEQGVKEMWGTKDTSHVCFR